MKNLITKVKTLLSSPDPQALRDSDGLVPQALQKGAAWIPWAHQSAHKMKTRGKYAHGWPQGLVVHFTAGRYEGGLSKAIDTILHGIENGFTYLCIAQTGEVVQAHPVNEWGYHAGESNWPGLGKGVSKCLIGVEINNAGKLTVDKFGLFQTWFKTAVPEKDVRFVDEKDWGCPTGHYHKYTAEQEEALIKLCLWLKRNDPSGKFSFDNVLGHHEVAGKKGIGYWRKNDPGGALSVPMESFRTLLKARWNEENQKP